MGETVGEKVIKLIRVYADKTANHLGVLEKKGVERKEGEKTY